MKNESVEELLGIRDDPLFQKACNYHFKGKEIQFLTGFAATTLDVTRQYN